MTVIEQNNSNIDYLIPRIRLHYGDLEGTLYTDAAYRTALLNSVRALQEKLDYKYQVFDENNILPLPIGSPSGKVYIATAKGSAYVDDVYVTGDVFRNPFIEFEQPKPLIEIKDEQGIVYYATYLLRKVQISSDARQFYSWRTEDTSFSNLGTEKILSTLLAEDIARVNELFGRNTINPKIVGFERIK